MDTESDPNPVPPPESAPLVPVPSSVASTPDERQWAMFCHLGGLVGHALVGFGHVVVPLVLWLIKREEMPFVNQEGKEAVNFQLSITLYGIVSGLASFFCIGFLMLIAVGIFDLIVVIMACIEVSNGKAYRYPLCIRFIK
jgi:uncharacterized Tic20 family protein